MARPKIYADATERQSAFRARNAKVDATISKEMDASIKEIAVHLDVSKNMLVRSMLRFALTNHNWKKSGIVWGGK